MPDAGKRGRAQEHERMKDLLAVFAVALLPVAGNLVGAAAAELADAPRWAIGAALHGATGVAIALVSVELMPRALQALPATHIVLPFAAGAALSVLIFRLLEAIRATRADFKMGAWLVYTATTLDLLSDGLMTGASSAIAENLGLLLGLSQVIANVPAGFATVTNMRRHGLRRLSRILASGLLALPVLASAALGHGLLREASARAQGMVLAAITGVLLASTVEDLVPQADEPGAARWISTASFVAGFSFLLLLSAYFG
jgi:ZIP family zinc transporter